MHTTDQHIDAADPNSDPWIQAAVDYYRLPAGELRALMVRTVALALHPHLNGLANGVAVDELETAAAAALDAATPLIETATRQAAAATAFEEAGEHLATCHAYAASERIALAVAQHRSIDELGASRGSCTASTATGVGRLTAINNRLDQVTAMLEEILQHVAPLPTSIKRANFTGLAAEPRQSPAK